MTFPGHQDWAKYAIPSADNVVSDNVAAVTNYTGPTADCSYWSSVNVVMQNFDLSASLDVSVGWAGYTSSVENLNTDVFVVGPNQFASIALPVRGRTVQLSYSSIVTTPVFGARYGIAGMSHPLSKYDVKNDIASLLNDTSTYAANSVKTFSMNNWYEGPVQVSAFSDLGNSAYVEMQFYDRIAFAYATFALIQINPLQTTMPHVVYYPPAPVRAVVHNLGALQTIGTHLVAAPVY